MLTALLSMTAAMTGFTPPLGVRPAVTGKRTQMLTLGSAHLSEFKSLTPAMLEPLLDRLQRFGPTIITHENVSGEQCDMMRRAPRYKDSVETYCWDAAPAQKLAGLTQQQAEAEADRVLEAWAATPNRSPSASDRRKLAMLFLAAGDRGSSWVQWLRLPAAERRVADGLDAEMVAVLARTGKPMNESYDVAAALAARLGLDRTYAVDDHSSDAALPHAGKAYEAAMTARFAKFRGSPLLTQYLAASERVKDGRSMLAFYRFMNEPRRLAEQVRGDFGGAFADAEAAPYGRHYGPGGKCATCACWPISAPPPPSIPAPACSMSSGPRTSLITMAGRGNGATSTWSRSSRFCVEPTLLLSWRNDSIYHRRGR